MFGVEHTDPDGVSPLGRSMAGFYGFHFVVDIPSGCGMMYPRYDMLFDIMGSDERGDIPQVVVTRHGSKFYH